MIYEGLYKKNILFIVTAKFDLVTEVIAHVRFLYKEAKIYVLAPEKLMTSFRALKGIDVVLDGGSEDVFSPSGVPLEVVQQLKSIRFEHVCLSSEFNTGNPLYYRSTLEFSESLGPNNVLLINHNLRIFPYNRELFSRIPQCEVCNSGMSFYRYTTYPSMSEPAPLYKCDRCNFISQDYSDLDSQSLREEYTRLEVPWFNFHGEMVDNDHREDLSTILRHVPDTSNILDLGCGVGGLEYYAGRDEERVNVISFDLNRASIDWARKHGINVHTVDITNMREMSEKLKSLGCERIDCIHCNNTLEHIVRPSEVLRMWMDLLRQNGYMHITIPTLDIVLDDYRGFEKYHLNYFTRDTFTKLVESIGLRIIESRIYEEDNHAGTGFMKYLAQKRR